MTKPNTPKPLKYSPWVDDFDPMLHSEDTVKTIMNVLAVIGVLLTIIAVSAFAGYLM